MRETERMQGELARLRTVIEAQLVMTRYASRMAGTWERRWSQLRSTLEGWHEATVQTVLVEMEQIEAQLDIDTQEPATCEVSHAELGYDGQHWCRTHKIWFNTPTGEAANPCPVGRVEGELARVRGGKA